MNKKAQGALPQTMVYVVAGAIALVVLIGAVGGFKPIFAYFAGRSVCVAHSVTGTGGTECVHWISLSKDNFTKFKKTTAKNAIDIWHKQPKYEKTAKYFGQDNWQTSYDADNEWILYEWMMDEVIAKELKYCKDLGVIYSFDNWWMGIDELATQKDEISAYERWFDFVQRPPILCKLCARIKFSEDLKHMFREKRVIDSLPIWMKNTPYAGGKSYYEYVLFEETGGLLEPNWRYDTNEPYAVVYARVKSSAINRYFARFTAVANILGANFPPSPREKDVHSLLLIPYNQYSETCDLPI